MPNSFGSALTGEVPHRDVRPEFKELIERAKVEPVLCADVEAGGFHLLLPPRYKTGDNVAVDAILKYAAKQMDPDTALLNALRGVWE